MEALLEAALRLAAPLLLAALGELVVERAGVVNIGVEGMMLTGAFVGFATGVATDSASVGVIAAALAAPRHRQLDRQPGVCPQASD
jgi:simple sugar transport system permease protein